jgi:hypothetical protein
MLSDTAPAAGAAPLGCNSRTEKAAPPASPDAAAVAPAPAPAPEPANWTKRRALPDRDAPPGDAPASGATASSGTVASADADADAASVTPFSDAAGRDDAGREPPLEDSGRRMRAADVGRATPAPAPLAPAFVGSGPSSLRAVCGADGSDAASPPR